MPIAAFEALNKRQAEAGLRLFANPRNSAAGSLRQKDPRSPPAATCRCGPTSSAPSRAAPGFAAHHETLEWLRALGLPVNPEIRTLGTLDEVYEFCQHWLEHRHDLPYEIDGVVVKVDDLGRAARAGRDVEGAALGDRLQVPARGAHDPAQGHQGVDRPHRQGHAVRRARAGVRRRLDGRAGHAAQRGPGQGQGRPARRHGHRAQGGRRHPRGGEAGARRPARRACPSGTFPTECPVCGGPLVRLEGESDTFCTNVDCPGQRWARIGHFACRGGDGHRGLRRAHGRRCSSTRELIDDIGDIYSHRLGPGARARGLRRDLGRQPAAGHRGVEERGRWPTCSSGSASATSAPTVAQRPGPPLRPPRPDHGRLRGARSPRSRASARPSPRACTSSSPTSATAR